MIIHILVGFRLDVENKYLRELNNMMCFQIKIKTVQMFWRWMDSFVFVFKYNIFVA